MPLFHHGKLSLWFYVLSPKQKSEGRKTHETEGRALHFWFRALGLTGFRSSDFMGGFDLKSFGLKSFGLKSLSERERRRESERETCLSERVHARENLSLPCHAGAKGILCPLDQRFFFQIVDMLFLICGVNKPLSAGSGKRSGFRRKIGGRGGDKMNVSFEKRHDKVPLHRLKRGGEERGGRGSWAGGQNRYKKCPR